MHSPIYLLVAALLPAAMAVPAEAAGGAGLEARAKPKLNQYASLADCNSDSNILFHAAPVSGRCYDFDDKTQAFFWATGGMLNPRVYTNKGCTGTEDPLSTNGRCHEKGSYRSFKMW